MNPIIKTLLKWSWIGDTNDVGLIDWILAPQKYLPLGYFAGPDDLEPYDRYNATVQAKAQ